MQKHLHLKKQHNGHTRYQLIYKGIPVWGYQLMEHSNGKKTYTGHVITGLDKDITTTKPKWSEEQIIKSLNLENKKNRAIKKIIYLDNHKGKLAYFVSYYQYTNNQLSKPNLIVDAMNGTILFSFNSLHSKRIGQGPGGNYIRLPYRDGVFQYGDIQPLENSLGRIDVQVKQGRCYFSNSKIQVINMQNKAFDEALFPVDAESQKKLPVFSYPCNKKSRYINRDDEGYAPVNEGLSPINDVMYFAQTTLDMYKIIYGDDNPLGDDLPLRAYVHVNSLDNAISFPTDYDENGTIKSHQQIVLGNGRDFFTPMTQTTIPHELSHNVTDQYSNLIYNKHSGAINEAFSDMADVALRDYLSRLYPWYWDGKDWTIGLEESLDGTPIRYMAKPSDDGYSIDSAKDYYGGLNVHFSSGVFNRAFYLLAHKDNWNIQRAFQVMFDANRYYWVPNTNFDFAACGVIQAAKDRNWGTAAVIEAFKQVDVQCPLL